MRRLLFAAAFVVAASCAPAKAETQNVPCLSTVVPGQGCAQVVPPQATTSAIESNHLFKGSGGTILGFQVNISTCASPPCWVLLFDAATLPSNGSVTGCTNPAATRPCISKWYQVNANTTLGVSWAGGPPLTSQTGILLACSTTGPFTLTATAQCTFSAEVE